MSYLGVHVAHPPLLPVFLRILSSSCRRHDPITGLAAVAGNATRTTTLVIAVVFPSRSLSLSLRFAYMRVLHNNTSCTRPNPVTALPVDTICFVPVNKRYWPPT